jgi:CBS-domain-containing membrane protein
MLATTVRSVMTTDVVSVQAFAPYKDLVRILSAEGLPAHHRGSALGRRHRPARP